MVDEAPKSARERRQAVGRRLVEMRDARQMKQAELCRLSGVSSSQVSQYETGKRDIPRDVAVSLVVAVDGSLDFLFLDLLDRCPADMRAAILRNRNA